MRQDVPQQRRTSDKKSKKALAACPVRTSDGQFRMDVTGVSLTRGTFPIDVGDLSLPNGTRPLSAELPGSIDRALFAIGEVQTDEQGSVVVIFGTPEFETQTLVF